MMRLTDEEIEHEASDITFFEGATEQKAFEKGAKWARSQYEHDLKMMKWDYERCISAMIANAGYYFGEKILKDFEDWFKVLKERWTNEPTR